MRGGPDGVAVGLVRFALELSAVVVLGMWGWQAGGNGVTRIVLAVGAPLLIAVMWGQFVAPRAPRYLERSGRLAVEAGVFGAAVLAFAGLGHPHAAGVFAVLAVADTALVHAGRHDEHARAAVRPPGGDAGVSPRPLEPRTNSRLRRD